MGCDANDPGRGHAILPGFVNAHCHTASIVFRSQTDDPPGGVTLYTIGFRGEQELTPEEWHDLAGVGAIDMVKAGVTTINDIYYEPDGLAAACAALGLRAQLCDEIFDVRQREPDRRRLHALSRARRSKIEEEPRISARAGTEGRRAHHHPPRAPRRRHLRAGVPARDRSEANRLGIGLHIHAAQSANEVEVVKQMYGRSSLEHLAASR